MYLSINKNVSYIIADHCMQGNNTKDDLPPVFAKARFDDLYEGRIKLDPIEENEQSKLPSPHMSAPILPPIRPRPASYKIKDQPTSNTLAAISHNLTNLRFVYIHNREIGYLTDSKKVEISTIL